MSNANEIEAIRRRREEIEAEIAQLRSEADEIDIALRVLGRFTPVKRENEQPKLGPARPEGLPSNFDMFAHVILEAKKSGRSGLSASEIVEAVGRRFWPGVQGPQLSSFIYQFAKKGRLSKGPDGRFRLPEDSGDTRPQSSMMDLDDLIGDQDENAPEGEADRGAFE